ncbi:MAG: tRNA (adenosine(37)-N6)-threonylcarbamoyltransferase complex transferase subunit TsaD [bacterium]
MKILGIESSCDDTSAALLDCSEQGCFIVSEKTVSQIDIHKKYGGVVPELAGRAHAEKITPLVEKVLENQPKPDVIAVTAGPGLITGLMVGVETARALSYIWNIPLVAINHIEGHIYSVLINQSKNLELPAVALIASGGHTELVLISDHGHYQLLGATRDDASGECFDKVAKLLKLPYPGGPRISRLAELGNPQAIELPRPMLNSHDFNFSFSGLKTSAMYWIKDHTKYSINDFCASFEQAVVDVLTNKTLQAVEEYQPKTIILAGGVSANKKLRNSLQKEINKKTGGIFLAPEINYCMDNSAMIAIAGYYHAKNNDFTTWPKIQADPNWRLAV